MSVHEWIELEVDAAARSSMPAGNHQYAQSWAAWSLSESAISAGISNTIDQPVVEPPGDTKEPDSRADRISERTCASSSAVHANSVRTSTTSPERRRAVV